MAVAVCQAAELGTVNVDVERILASERAAALGRLFAAHEELDLPGWGRRLDILASNSPRFEALGLGVARLKEGSRPGPL